MVEVFKDSFVRNDYVSCDDMEQMVNNWVKIEWYIEIIDETFDKDLEALKNFSEIDDAEFFFVILQLR